VPGLAAENLYDTFASLVGSVLTNSADTSTPRQVKLPQLPPIPTQTPTLEVRSFVRKGLLAVMVAVKGRYAPCCSQLWRHVSSVGTESVCVQYVFVQAACARGDTDMVQLWLEEVLAPKQQPQQQAQEQS
jgi:hypothetical protein